MKAQESKGYAFLDLEDQEAQVKETAETKGLSEEIRIVLEDTGMTVEDLTDRANAKDLVLELYNQGFRPTIFVPADQYLDLALELGGYGVVIPKEVKHSRTVVNPSQDNTMVHNVKKENILDVNRGLVTLGRTPFVKEAGYVVELDVPEEDIVPLLTAAPGSTKAAFRGVVHLKSDKVTAAQMKVVKVVAPSGQKKQVMDLQNKLAEARKEME